MRAIRRNDPTHPHLGRTLQQSLGNNRVGLGDALQSTSDGQDTIMDTLHDLADTSLNASLVAQVRNVLAALADDDAGFLGGDDGAEGELGLGVLLVGFGAFVALTVGVEAVHGVGELIGLSVGVEIVGHVGLKNGVLEIPGSGLWRARLRLRLRYRE